MTRREALTAIFGPTAALLVAAADIAIIDSSLVVTFAEDHLPFDLDQMEAIRADLADIVRGVPIVVCAGSTRMEPLYPISPNEDHKAALTICYDAASGVFVDRPRGVAFGDRGYTELVA